MVIPTCWPRTCVMPPPPSLDSKQSSWAGRVAWSTRHGCGCPTPSAALVAYDWVAVSELGGHPFLTFQLFRSALGPSYAEPLGFERAYARSLAHWSYPYPDHTT
jgi:hypothetical protein